MKQAALVLLCVLALTTPARGSLQFAGAVLRSKQFVESSVNEAIVRRLSVMEEAAA